LPPNLEGTRPEVEQLRRWFEQRGGTLASLREGVGAASNAWRGAAAGRGGSGRWLKVGFVVSSAMVLLTTGLLAGRTWSGRHAVDVPAQAPARPPVTRVVNRTVVPPPCLVALNQGDVAMRLLRGNPRDPRLAGAVRAYQRSRDDCRRQAPRH
jgi:hypothetical protein